MWRSVVLHLHPWLKMILTRRHDRSLPDALSTAECGQGRIRQFRSGRRQFFMDSHEIPLARSQQVEDLLAVGFGLAISYPRVRPEPPAADEAWSLPSLWHRDDPSLSSRPDSQAQVNSECLGHFWRVSMGHFWGSPSVLVQAE